MAPRAVKTTPEAAAALALAGLSFIAEDTTRLGRFLSLTGIGPDELRAAADAPETLLAVFDYLLEDESLLLVFTAAKDVRPEDIYPARVILARSLGIEPAHD